MLRKFVKRKPSVLDAEIDKIVNRMHEFDPETDEYNAMMDRLEKLYLLKNQEKSSRVSPDTVAIICGNLAGILIIVGYERINVVTTRAVGMLLRTKHQ